MIIQEDDHPHAELVSASTEVYHCNVMFIFRCFCFTYTSKHSFKSRIVIFFMIYATFPLLQI